MQTVHVWLQNELNDTKSLQRLIILLTSESLTLMVDWVKS